MIPEEFKTTDLKEALSHIEALIDVIHSEDIRMCGVTREIIDSAEDFMDRISENV